MQQVHDLLERRPRGEVLDRVPDVPEPTGLAVDVREPGGRCDDLFQTLVRHAGPLASRCPVVVRC